MTPEEFRESAARTIEARADLYQKDGEPGDLATAWGWRTIAEEIRKAAEIVRSHPVASPWIPVGERLPEIDVEVVVFDDHSLSGVVMAKYEGQGKDGFQFWRAEGFGSLLYDVTHWMPRPEPPTEPTP